VIEQAFITANRLRARIDALELALSDPSRTMFNPETFEPFGEDDPARIDYLDAIAANRDKFIAELSELVEKYPELGTITGN
jgi:hypothetical protein